MEAVRTQTHDPSWWAERLLGERVLGSGTVYENLIENVAKLDIVTQNERSSKMDNTNTNTTAELTGDTFTLGELAQRVAGGNVTAMAKMLNDVGAKLDEIEPDPGAVVARRTAIDLFARRAGDSVGRRLRVILGETMERGP